VGNKITILRVCFWEGEGELTLGFDSNASTNNASLCLEIISYGRIRSFMQYVTLGELSPGKL